MCIEAGENCLLKSFCDFLDFNQLSELLVERIILIHENTIPSSDIFPQCQGDLYLRLKELINETFKNTDIIKKCHDLINESGITGNADRELLCMDIFGKDNNLNNPSQIYLATLFISSPFLNPIEFGQHLIEGPKQILGYTYQLSAKDIKTVFSELNELL